jgi:putative acetyltransferase
MIDLLPEVTIRRYTTADLSAVVSVWEAATHQVHPFMSDEYLKHEKYQISEVFLPNSLSWVVVYDGAIRGFISMLGSEIGGLFVAPEYQRTGLGCVLLNKVKELHGIIEVKVFEKNVVGRRFYENEGFQFFERVYHELTSENMLSMRLKQESITRSLTL